MIIFTLLAAPVSAQGIPAGQGRFGSTGANHRATYADFQLVQGGVIMLTEDGQRIDYLCQ